MDRTPTAWIEVDLGAIRHNLREIQRAVGDACKILAVVKADAYGHGMVEVSRFLLAEGAYGLGVTRIEDALALREAGISAPVLVFGSTLPEDAPSVVEQGIEQTVCSLELAEALSAAAAATGRTARVHVKVDTGMGRLGVLPSEVVELAAKLGSLPGIDVAGVYTHLATAADRDKSLAASQLRVFDRVLAHLRAAEINYGLAHAAASAAILAFPQSRHDMVRPGTLLYGQYPSRYVPRTLDLRDTWALKTRVSLVRALPHGSRVGYGADYVTRRQTRTAILPLGYSDGLTLVPESVAGRSSAALIKRLTRWNAPLLTVSVRGRRAPVLGRMAMEMCAVDVTDVPGVEVGDEVIVPCRRTSASSRIPRVYVNA